MDIRRAVEVLNEREWEGARNWTVARDGGAVRQTRNPIGTSHLPEFIAIAIAEKYERGPATDKAMPVTRRIVPVYRRFLELTDEAHVPDCQEVIRNNAGSFTLGDLKAAVAEWEGL